MLCNSFNSEYQDDVVLDSLRCEYRMNPLGIDVVKPQLSWVIKAARRGWSQSAYQVLAASDPKGLEQDKGNLWDSGKVESNRSVGIVYGGEALGSGSQCWWKLRVWDEHGKVCKWSQPAWWETGLLKSEDWTSSWIDDGKATPKRDEDFYKDDRAPLFRKVFQITRPIKRARLYISGLGYYEACLNSRKIGDNVLDPGWTDYSKCILYSTYDVTESLTRGENCLSVMLGNGWYNPLPMKMWGSINLREKMIVGRPRLIVQMNIDYEDGTSESITSDESWKVGEGPIVRNNIYLGEEYDARCEQPGWDQKGFDDSAWKFANKISEPIDILRAQQQPAIKVTETIEVVKITEPENGVYIFDMGQNFAGFVRLCVNGPSGTKVKLRYGELLYPDGRLNVLTSVCGQIKPNPNDEVPQAGPGYAGKGAPDLADQSDTYILKGDGEEVYTPRFTFHGFRYVEVTGLPQKPDKKTLMGLRLNSAVESAGTFSCSNEMFNQIHKMSKRTFQSNIFSVQSDCPTRERFGYGGDIVATAEMGIFNFDMSNFYNKSICDFADAALTNGSLASTAPSIKFVCNIGWALAHPVLQSLVYQYYGNKRIVNEQYETTRRLVEFFRSLSKNNIIEITGDGLSDHESLDPKSVALTSTAFYYHCVNMLARFARILGGDKDLQLYSELALQIKGAFTDKFLKKETGEFDIHTQACQAFAFYYDMVPEDQRKAAIDVMLNEIVVAHKGHLSTGIFGTKYLLEVLTEIGRADVAYMIVNQRTFPGWGYMLEKGATTLWEHWAFSDDIFSHNHPMFGSVSEWLFKTIAGIRPHCDAVGFDRIIISPEVLDDLKWAKGTYKSIHGEIVSDWRIENDTMHLNVTVPANTSATIYLPAKHSGDITESGTAAVTAKGVNFLGIEGPKAIFAVNSGCYQFVSKL